METSLVDGVHSVVDSLFFEGLKLVFSEGVGFIGVFELLYLVALELFGFRDGVGFSWTGLILIWLIS